MFTFANPFLLWLFPLLALPWIFRRRQEERIQHIEFPMLRFLRESEERELINPKLQEWLLLILRTLLLALLLLAFAGPKWVSEAGGAAPWFSFLPFGSAMRSSVTVTDASYSMRYGEGADAWWARAARTREDIEGRLGGVTARHAWNREVRDRSQAGKLPSLAPNEEKELFEQPPEAPGAPFADLFAQLNATHPGRERVILITDGQRLPWKAMLGPDAAALSLPPALAILVGGETPDNAWFSVDSLSSPPWGIAGWETIAGRVRAVGGETGAERSIAISGADGTALFNRAATPAGGGDEAASAAFQFTAIPARLAAPEAPDADAPGSIVIDIQLVPEDALPFDNRMRLEIPFADRFRAGLAHDASNPPQGVEFISTALAPGEGFSNVEIVPVSPPDAFFEAGLGLAAVNRDYVPWWSPADSTSLLNYVKQGGAALIFTGGSPSDNHSWEQLLSEIGWEWGGERGNAEPAVETPGGARKDPVGAMLSDWAPAMWNPWLPSRHGSLTGGRRQALAVYTANGETREVIAGRALGEGRLWIVNSALNADSPALWSPILPALLWEAAKEAARINGGYEYSPPPDRTESDLRLLTEDDKRFLTEKYGIRFADAANAADEIERLFGGVDLRFALLFLAIAAALAESWLANRMAAL